VIAASDGKGLLSMKSGRCGFYHDHSGSLVAWLTYQGLGWFGVILGARRPSLR